MLVSLGGPRSGAQAAHSPGPHPRLGMRWVCFPLAEVAEAHRVSEQGHVRGKLVLLVG